MSATVVCTGVSDLMAALSHITMGLVLLGAGFASAEIAHTLEVFTTASRPVSDTTTTRFPNVAVTVYGVDGIERLEATLSKGLSTDPGVAREEALQRIGQLDAPETEAAKHAALGLVRAARLGIDRVPAIVLDGERVVYGITDLEVAFDRLFAESRELTP